MKRLALTTVAALAALVVSGCGGESEPTVFSSGEGRPAHIHGLAMVDGQVLAAAHNGLWRVADGKASRVGTVRDDLMGFTVASDGRFLASGHPADPGGGSSHLGLVASADAGRSWQNVSLPGQADFHALASSGTTVYGYDAGRLLVSQDGGTTWKEESIEDDVLSLAMSARDDRVVLAGTGTGVKLRSGGRWRTVLAGQPALVSWPAVNELVAVALDGEISVSTNRGQTWTTTGATPGAPVAAHSTPETLVVASEDGSISRSSDRGKRWAQLLAPAS